MSKIKELLNDANNVLVFDVDGVLAVLELGDYNHYDLTDEEWVKACNKGINYYTDDIASEKMKKFLESKDMSRIYVITSVLCEMEEKYKKDFVKNNYNISSENVYCVRKDSEKLEKFLEIKSKYPDVEDKKIVMIEDSITILNNIMENTNCSTAHISSFIDL